MNNELNQDTIESLIKTFVRSNHRANKRETVNTFYANKASRLAGVIQELINLGSLDQEQANRMIKTYEYRIKLNEKL